MFVFCRIPHNPFSSAAGVLEKNDLLSQKARAVPCKQGDVRLGYWVMALQGLGFSLDSEITGLGLGVLEGRWIRESSHSGQPHCLKRRLQGAWRRRTSAAGAAATACGSSSLLYPFHSQLSTPGKLCLRSLHWRHEDRRRLLRMRPSFRRIRPPDLFGVSGDLVSQVMGAWIGVIINIALFRNLVTKSLDLEA